MPKRYRKLGQGLNLGAPRADYIATENQSILQHLHNRGAKQQ